MRFLFCSARRLAGQPPTAPMGGGFTPTRGRGQPFVICTDPLDQFGARTLVVGEHA